MARAVPTKDFDTIEKGAHITGAARRTITAKLKRKYENGATIRMLAESSGRSYGFVQRVLTESGVRLRSRGGGSHRSKHSGQ